MNYPPGICLAVFFWSFQYEHDSHHFAWRRAAETGAASPQNAGSSGRDCRDRRGALAWKNESEEKDKKGTYLRREFSYTQFTRKMILPDNVVNEKITAKVENGVLTVDIPTIKEEEKVSKVKQIDIQ